MKRYVIGFFNPSWMVIVSVESCSHLREDVIFTRSGHEEYDLKFLRWLQSNYKFDI